MLARSSISSPHPFQIQERDSLPLIESVEHADWLDQLISIDDPKHFNEFYSRSYSRHDFVFVFSYRFEFVIRSISNPSIRRLVSHTSSESIGGSPLSRVLSEFAGEC